MKTGARLPTWLTKPLSDPAETRLVRETLKTHRVTTVCNEAKCPNRVDCFSRGTATFMILGDRCTRDCGFCAVSHGSPLSVDPVEPDEVASAATALGLDFVVVTSVTRDDLPDGGAAQFAATIRAIRGANPRAGIEVLVPDFGGSPDAIEIVLAAAPDVFGHNVETIERLYPVVRKGAGYERSLGVLSRAAGSRSGALVKSGLMLGMGETRQELSLVLADVLAAGVEIIYLGQYLRPSAGHHPVARFVPPEEFDE
ncbi:MAG: lipoyl synthase, partial [Candidatus Eisenbacteria bacterium]|nr:lipoyl synthase [Candidatus Eisenbacteria bacterium]